ncbi:hypothetical protein C8R47DRAFT_1081210 [Mycena vitilis]|nr:hypothetical protein C8R47DRAFT_1081210 [Mycena vitilis]
MGAEGSSLKASNASPANISTDASHKSPRKRQKANDGSAINSNAMTNVDPAYVVVQSNCSPTQKTRKSNHNSTKPNQVETLQRRRHRERVASNRQDTVTEDELLWAASWPQVESDESLRQITREHRFQTTSSALMRKPCSFCNRNELVNDLRIWNPPDLDITLLENAVLILRVHYNQPRIQSHLLHDDFATWPVPSECREQLQKIKDSHVIREFRVFDVDGSIVDPSNIPSKLVGVLVECSFGIVQYSFGSDDSFSGIIHQVVILRPAPLKPASPFKGTRKAYRPPALSPEEVHAQEQLAVNAFTQPISRPGPSNTGPSNLPVPSKRAASKEPEGSVTKRPNLTESPAIVNATPNDDSAKGKEKAPEPAKEKNSNS